MKSVNKNPRTDNGEDENAADAREAVRLHRPCKVLNFHVLGWQTFDGGELGPIHMLHDGKF